jgi:hypothetical protein
VKFFFANSGELLQHRNRIVVKRSSCLMDSTNPKQLQLRSVVVVFVSVVDSGCEWILFALTKH